MGQGAHSMGKLCRYEAAVSAATKQADADASRANGALMSPPNDRPAAAAAVAGRPQGDRWVLSPGAQAQAVAAMPQCTMSLRTMSRTVHESMIVQEIMLYFVHQAVDGLRTGCEMAYPLLHSGCSSSSIAATESCARDRPQLGCQSVAQLRVPGMQISSCPVLLLEMLQVSHACLRSVGCHGQTIGCEA